MKKEKNEPKKMTAPERLNVLNQWDIYMEHIFSTQTVAEKAIYTYFFWLTIAKGIRECQLSYSDFHKATGIKSDLTLSKHLNNLIKKRHVKLIERKFNIPSIYRVYSPLEIVTPDKYDKKLKKESK